MEHLELLVPTNYILYPRGYHSTALREVSIIKPLGEAPQGPIVSLYHIMLIPNVLLHYFKDVREAGGKHLVVDKKPCLHLTSTNSVPHPKNVDWHSLRRFCTARERPSRTSISPHPVLPTWLLTRSLDLLRSKRSPPLAASLSTSLATTYTIPRTRLPNFLPNLPLARCRPLRPTMASPSSKELRSPDIVSMVICSTSKYTPRDENPHTITVIPVLILKSTKLI